MPKIYEASVRVLPVRQAVATVGKGALRIADDVPLRRSWLGSVPGRLMKHCAQCGLENGDDATQCRECGSTEWVVAVPTADAPAPWERVAVLEYEVEAEHLSAELTSQNIPHVMRSYHDSALDGLFQLSRGWGDVEAPSEYRDAVLSILKGIRQDRK